MSACLNWVMCLWDEWNLNLTSYLDAIQKNGIEKFVLVYIKC